MIHGNESHTQWDNMEVCLWNSDENPGKRSRNKINASVSTYLFAVFSVLFVYVHVFAKGNVIDPYRSRLLLKGERGIYHQLMSCF